MTAKRYDWAKNSTRAREKPARDARAFHWIMLTVAFQRRRRSSAAPAAKASTETVAGSGTASGAKLATWAFVPFCTAAVVGLKLVAFVWTTSSTDVWPALIVGVSKLNPTTFPAPLLRVIIVGMTVPLAALWLASVEKPV